MANVRGPTGLTSKQEKFVMAIAEGNTQTKAYKIAFNTSKMSEKTITEKASKLMSQNNVRARCDELRGKVAEKLEEKAIFTVEGILYDLKELIERNKEYDDKVALKGIETAMRHLGMFIDKVEHSGKIDINEKSKLIEKYLGGDED